MLNRQVNEFQAANNKYWAKIVEKFVESFRGAFKGNDDNDDKETKEKKVEEFDLTSQYVYAPSAALIHSHIFLVYSPVLL